MRTLKKHIAILGMLLFTGMALAQSVSDCERIKDFYVRYMEAIEVGEDELNMRLVQMFLTPEMQAKMGRLVDATGADPLLRAQDVSAYGRQSLRCKHLEGDWYMVSYWWSEADSVGKCIPIRLVKDGKGQLRIGYVTPIGHEKTTVTSFLTFLRQMSKMMRMHTRLLTHSSRRMSIHTLR